MLALTPVTVKSTKSMLAMQRLQPEMKKLQAKYKGPENREQLNQEMMRLYKENGTSPFGACLPSLLQMPFLIVLYSLIRGLSYTVPRVDIYQQRRANGQLPGKSRMCVAAVHPDQLANAPRIWWPVNGQMHWWFGMDLSSLPFSHHTSPGSASQALLVIPYLVLIAAAMFLQYYQMKQMNSRNPQAAAANPQMQTMQKFFPIIFGVIYLRVPAGATIYMVVSSAMRIGTQDFMFRTGMVTPVVHEREIGSAKAGQGEGGQAAETAAEAGEEAVDRHRRDGGWPRARLPPTKNGSDGPTAAAATNGRKPAAAGSGRRTGKARTTRTRRAGTQAHPRSRSKRDEKGSIASGVGRGGGQDRRGGNRARPGPAGRGRRRRRGDRGQPSPRPGLFGRVRVEARVGPGCAPSGPAPAGAAPAAVAESGQGGRQGGQRQVRAAARGRP